MLIGGPNGKYNAGNGSLMRLAPVPLFYMNNPQMGIIMSGENSSATHQTPVAIDACRYLGALIIGVLHETSKMEIHLNFTVLLLDFGTDTCWPPSSVQL